MCPQFGHADKQNLRVVNRLWIEHGVTESSPQSLENGVLASHPRCVEYAGRQGDQARILTEPFSS